MLVLTCHQCSKTFADLKHWFRQLPTFSDICGHSLLISQVKWSSRDLLSSLYDQILITAAEMSLPDALDYMLAGHPSIMRDRDVLPISRHPCRLTDIKLKIHIEIQGETHIHAHTSTNGKKLKTFNSMAFCIQNSSEMGGLCSGGGPPWRVDCVQYENHCNTYPLLSFHQVEHSTLYPHHHLPGNRRWAGHQPR